MPFGSDSLQTGVIIFYMAPSLECFYIFFKRLSFFGRKRPVQESFQDVTSGLRGRVAHILRIETGVSKLIHNYFICRKIICLI